MSIHYVATDRGQVLALLASVGMSDGTRQLDTTRDPLPTDDLSVNFSQGSLWVNNEPTAMRVWWCMDATEGAAVWAFIGNGPGGSAPSTLPPPGFENFINRDGSVAMEADLQLGGSKVVGLADPTDDQDAATKAYVDAGAGGGPPPDLSLYLELAGGTMTGPIVQPMAPVADGDLVNKEYVDNLPPAMVEPPDDGPLYGRGRDPLTWEAVVALDGDTMRGPLTLPGGNAANPSLLWGNGGIAMYQQGVSSLVISIGGQPIWLFNAALSFSRSELDLGGFNIHNVADPVSDPDAANKRYVDLIAMNDLYRGDWQVAANVPDLVTANPTDNGVRYVCLTADPDVGEVADAAMPGIGGQTIFNGSYITWSNQQARWSMIVAGSLTKSEADTLYLSLTGGTVDGSVVINETLRVGTDTRLDGDLTVVGSAVLEADASIAGNFVAPLAPTLPDHLANKAYVDSALSTGAATVWIGPAPPAAPEEGMLWWRSDPDGDLYIRYDDGTSQQWVPASPAAGSGGGGGGGQALFFRTGLTETSGTVDLDVADAATIDAGLANDAAVSPLGLRGLMGNSLSILRTTEQTVVPALNELFSMIVAGHPVQQLVDDITIPASNGTPITLRIQDSSVFQNDDGSLRQGCVYITNFTSPTNFSIGQYCYPLAIVSATEVSVLPWSGTAWNAYGENAGTVIRGGINFVMLAPHPQPSASALVQPLSSQWTVPMTDPLASTAMFVRASYPFRPYTGTGICFCLRYGSDQALSAYFRVISVNSNTQITVSSFGGQPWGRYGSDPGSVFPSGLIFPCDPPKVPRGGTMGRMLSKLSDNDFDLGWV